MHCNFETVGRHTVSSRPNLRGPSRTILHIIMMKPYSKFQQKWKIFRWLLVV